MWTSNKQANTQLDLVLLRQIYANVDAGVSGGARSFFLPGHNRDTINISNGARLTVTEALTVAQRPRSRKPGLVLKLGFWVSGFATTSACLLCGIRWHCEFLPSDLSKDLQSVLH